MSPKHLGGNRYQLLDKERLSDHWDPNLVIEAPEIVMEEPLGKLERGKQFMRYQGKELVIGVQAKTIEEAIKKCRPEG